MSEERFRGPYVERIVIIVGFSVVGICLTILGVVAGAQPHG